MVVNCQHVWKEISNYLDGEVDAALRVAMEAHFAECKHCTAVIDGARNVVQLYGDDRLFELPAGFSRRLQRRLAAESGSSSFAGLRSFWMLAVAAGALLAGVVGLGNSSVFAHPDPRSRLAQPAYKIPPELKVVVSSEGKLFHVPGCRYLHNRVGENPGTITAAQATREGFAPCPRCLHQYLTGAVECPRSPFRHEPSIAKAQFLGRGGQQAPMEWSARAFVSTKQIERWPPERAPISLRTSGVFLVGFQSRQVAAGPFRQPVNWHLVPSVPSGAASFRSIHRKLLPAVAGPQ